MFAISEPDSGEEFSEFHTENLRERLSQNEYWCALPEKHREHLLRKNQTLHSPDEILKRAGFDAKECRAIYAYLSAHTHCDSVSFIRTGEGGRGQGFINDADLLGITTCLDFSGTFMLFATTNTDEFFKGALERAKTVKDFRPFEIELPPRPWAGTSFNDL